MGRRLRPLASARSPTTLPHPSILAAEIVEDLRAALAQFQEIADDLATDEAAV